VICAVTYIHGALSKDGSVAAVSVLARLGQRGEETAGSMCSVGGGYNLRLGSLQHKRHKTNSMRH
jgi:hypothetical protein